MRKTSVAGAIIALAFIHSPALSAPVYLDCVAYGKEYVGGQVHYGFTLNENAQSASVTVKDTGHTWTPLVAAFSPTTVTVHEPGPFESDDFVIDRTTLKLRVTTTRDNDTRETGSGSCKVAVPPKRKF